MPEADITRTSSTGSGDRFLANLAYLVPGYRGYKEKGLRRQEDARLRSRVMTRLGDVKTLLVNRLDTLQEVNLEAAAIQLAARITRIEKISSNRFWKSICCSSRIWTTLPKWCAAPRFHLPTARRSCASSRMSTPHWSGSRRVW